MATFILLGLAWGPSARVQAQVPAESPDQAKIDVTFISNEGFLISYGDQRVLIDALYRQGMKEYGTIPPLLMSRMERGREPFEGIDLALTTHFHIDHFDPLSVGAFLVSNPAAVFVSTSQVKASLRLAFDFPRIEGQVRSVFPPPGTSESLLVGGVRLRVFNLHHGDRKHVENLGFLFELGGRRFLHIGDAQVGAMEFQSCGLQRERIDYAFIPHWYLTHAAFPNAIKEGLHADHIIVMHLPPKESESSMIRERGGWDAVIGQIQARFPGAIVFERLMETKSFEPRRGD